MRRSLHRARVLCLRGKQCFVFTTRDSPMQSFLVLASPNDNNDPMSSTPQPLIIAVDDEADDVFFLRHILQKTAFEHRFQPFANGEAAVIGLTAVAEQQDAPILPLVCFLDIKMAGMTGL